MMEERWISPDISTGALEHFARRLEQVGTQLHAMEIWQGGAPVLRWDIAPYRCDDRREVYSLSKSFTATAVGLAFDRGLLSPDDALSRFFPQQVAAQADERWQHVRLRHLLTMTVGHAECPMPRMAFAPDSVESFFSAPLVYEPGERFVYSTGASCMLAEVVRRVTGCTVPDWLTRELLGPMGVEALQWDTCADGRCQGGTGLKATCSEIALLGALYCARGVWKGRRLLSEEWVDMAGSLQVKNEDNGTPDWCAGYGFQFWRNKAEGYRCDGAFGQLCVILPQRDLSLAMVAESVNMSDELDVVWELLDHLYDARAGRGLPGAYTPAQRPSLGDWDSGWLRCGENAMGFTQIRLRCTGGALALTLCDGTRTQTVAAKPACWTENTIVVKNMQPLLYRQMRRDMPAPFRFAAAAAARPNALVFECRGLDTPHAFSWVFQPDETGVSVRIEAKLDVFGAACAWRAEQAKSTEYGC
ncbi:MAG TPA: beta-lactamase family protein [Candidatus Ruthenibacterium merdigallinarum]|nr:beta-lactamase family protein [Candidatus Ruthenibacterium merdigallinarum]